MASGFKNSSGTDFDDLFTSGTGSQTFNLKNSSGTDIGTLYLSASEGTAGDSCGFKNSSGTDIGTLLCKKGTKPIYLTNILPNFNSGSWTFSGCSQSGGIVTFPTGSSSTYMSQLSASSMGINYPVVNHIYYGRVYQKCDNTSGTVADGRFEWFYTDATNAQIVVAHFLNNRTTSWALHSVRTSVTSQYTTSAWYFRSFTVNSTTNFYRKAPMLVDLTNAFGSGNEPTKEWCDANIPEFYGSTTIYL